MQYGHSVGWSWGGCVLIRFTWGLRLCRSMVARAVGVELGWVSRTRLSFKLNRFTAASPAVPVQRIVTAPPDDVMLCSNVRMEGVKVTKADCVTSAEPMGRRHQRP